MKSVEVIQSFDQPLEKVWKAITEKDQMKQWFFEDIKDFKAEAGFETEFDVAFENRNFRHQWKITEVIPPVKIKYNWKYGGYAGDSFVTFELSEQNAKTRLKLIHEVVQDFPAEEAAFSRKSMQEGWNYLIGQRLKSYLDD